MVAQNPEGHGGWFAVKGAELFALVCRQSCSYLWEWAGPGGLVPSGSARPFMSFHGLIARFFLALNSIHFHSCKLLPGWKCTPPIFWALGALELGRSPMRTSSHC